MLIDYSLLIVNNRSQYGIIEFLCTRSVPLHHTVPGTLLRALRYAAILLDISDMSREDFDELLIEQKRSVIWIHFAVRPSENRRRCNFKR